MTGAPLAARDGLWLVLILALATAARIWRLDAPLWFDEIVMVTTHLRLPWSEHFAAYSMNHHYFHDVLAKLSVDAFGEAAWAVRLPAMIFGVAGIAATWVLARQVGGIAVAHVTALLLALSYHHIWFSQNARGYTMLAFFSTVAMILFLRGLRAPSRGVWIGFGLCLAAAVFTHLTGVFFFLALGLLWLAAIVFAGRDRPAGLVANPLIGAAVGIVIAAILYAPLVPGVITAAAEVGGTSAVDVMQEYQNPLWTAVEALRTGLGEAGIVATVVGVAVVVLILAGSIAAHGTAPLFAPAVVLGIALTVVVLMAIGMRLWPRFFFAEIGFLMILIVMGVQVFCGLFGRLLGTRGAAALFPLAAVAMVGISTALASRNYTAPKQDLAGAYERVEADRAPGERIYAVGYASGVFRDFYGTDWQPIFTPEDYAAAMGAPGPVTLVVAFPARSFRQLPELAADREDVLTEIAWLRGTLGDGGVVILRRDGR